jgi:hypothetical protein
VPSSPPEVALPARKRTELGEKIASLIREFEEWQAASEESGCLEKHHTQIRAVTQTLGPYLAEVTAQLQAARQTGEALLARSDLLELRILELHRIWDFFRSKLALRYVPWFRDYLLAADDFAWNCYRPVEARLGAGEVREPPLVFFNGGWSPFTLPRGTPYVAEAVIGEGMTTGQFQAALRELPIHVIGVPWFQIAHLPDAAVIGHEVGHDVEEELGLVQDLETLLNGALEAKRVPSARRGAWRAWLREVFADVYGTLASGSAYSATLIDFLASSTAVVTQEAPTAQCWRAYPTRWLRIMITLETLRQRGLDEQATMLHYRWSTAFPSHRLTEFDRDVAPVVEALVGGPYQQLQGGPLWSLVDFGVTEQTRAEEASEEVRGGREIPTDDVRCLIAAARLAFDEDPDKYLERDVPHGILEKIKKVQTIGTRVGPPVTAEAKAEQDAARAERDAEAGERLLAFVTEAHASRRAEAGTGRDV